jgi:hypothetical protein
VYIPSGSGCRRDAAPALLSFALDSRMHAAEHHSICWLKDFESVRRLTSIWATQVRVSNLPRPTPVGRPSRSLMPCDQGDGAGVTLPPSLLWSPAVRDHIRRRDCVYPLILLHLPLLRAMSDFHPRPLTLQARPGIVTFTLLLFIKFAVLCLCPIASRAQHNTEWYTYTDGYTNYHTRVGIGQFHWLDRSRGRTRSS